MTHRHEVSKGDGNMEPKDLLEARLTDTLLIWSRKRINKRKAVPVKYNKATCNRVKCACNC